MIILENIYLALQSLNGNYTTPTVTVSGTDGSEFIQYNGDLGSTSPMEAEVTLSDEETLKQIS